MPTCEHVGEVMELCAGDRPLGPVESFENFDSRSRLAQTLAAGLDLQNRLQLSAFLESSSV
jgi:hypothetical protein